MGGTKSGGKEREGVGERKRGGREIEKGVRKEKERGERQEKDGRQGEKERGWEG